MGHPVGKTREAQPERLCRTGPEVETRRLALGVVLVLDAAAGGGPGGEVAEFGAVFPG